MESRPILTESGRNRSMREYLEKSEGQNKLPPSFFLAMAAGAAALSLGLSYSRRRRNLANFTAQMIPTFLLLGIYNKIANDNESRKSESHSILH